MQCSDKRGILILVAETIVAERYFGRLCSPLNRFRGLCSRFRVLRSRLEALPRSVFRFPCSAFCVHGFIRFCVLCHSPRYLVYSRLTLFCVSPSCSYLLHCAYVRRLNLFCFLRSVFADFLALFCVLRFPIH